MKNPRKLLLVLLLISGTVCSKEKPNIIYIMADDLGYADLSGYGRKDFQTPNLDKLASLG
jgi:Sulfatase